MKIIQELLHEQNPYFRVNDYNLLLFNLSEQYHWNFSTICLIDDYVDVEYSLLSCFTENLFPYGAIYIQP